MVKRTRSSVLSIRISDNLRRYLESECKKSGRSLTEQVERCILKSMLSAEEFANLEAIKTKI